MKILPLPVLIPSTICTSKCVPQHSEQKEWPQANDLKVSVGWFAIHTGQTVVPNFNEHCVNGFGVLLLAGFTRAATKVPWASVSYKLMISGNDHSSVWSNNFASAGVT